MTESTSQPPTGDPQRGPRTFVSYSWDDEDHKAWVLHLATRLRRIGIDAVLDRWRRPGESLPQFMEREIRNAERVVAVLTPKYARQADDREAGGVAYEHEMITGLLLEGKRDLVVPVLRRGEQESTSSECAVPTAYLGRQFVDFRDDASFDDKLRELWFALSGISELAPPPLGPPPVLDAAATTITALLGGRVVGGSENVRLFVQGAVATQVADIATAVSDDTLRELETMRQRWREGRHAEVLSWLSRFDTTPSLLLLVPAITAARVLRFHAGILLDQATQTERAASLLDRARELDPTGDDRRPRAVLAWRRGNIADAVAVLDEASEDGPAERNLRAGLLLQDGRAGDALSVLESAEQAGKGVQSDSSTDAAVIAEAWRLRSLAHFALRNLESAESAIARAYAIAPAWISIRFVDATLKYFRSLAPTARPNTLPAWPPPVDGAFIRRDARGDESTQAALEIFDRLLEIEAEQDSRRQLETWRLACLSNLSDRHNEATGYASDVLTRDPTHPYILAWAVARGFTIDLNPNLTALRADVLRTPVSSHVLCLTNAYFAVGRADDAATLLDELRSDFAEQGQSDDWQYMRAHAALLTGDADGAHELSDSLSDDALRALRTAEFQIRAVDDGETASFQDYLEEVATETGDPRYLWETSAIHAQQGDWGYVVGKAEALLEQLGTLEVRRLVAFAYYNTGQMEECLAIVTTTIDQLADRSAITELRRLRAAALAALGLVPDAIAELTEITGRDSPTTDFMTLARLHALQGDLHQVASLAAKLRDRADLTAANAFGLAQIVAHVDRDLARTLWRVAVDRDLPDEAVGPAMALGMQLGLDQETAALTQRMGELAQQGRGGIQAVSIEELADRAEQWREDREELLGRYASGELPVHVAAPALNIPMVYLYHALLEEQAKRPNPLGQFVLRSRFGGRALPTSDPPIEPGSIALDVSGLLLAAHLELLDVLESTFAPLHLPFGIMQFFYEERNRLTQTQPSRIEVDRQLIDAEEQGLIAHRRSELPTLSLKEREASGSWAEWVAVLELARQNDAYVLDFPLEPDSPHGRPTAVAGSDRLGRIVTPRSVLDALFRDGQLIQEDYDQAIDSLGTSASPEADSRLADSPPRGATIHATHGALDSLVEAGLLPVLSSHFRILVDADEQDRRRGQIEAAVRGDRVVAWLDHLMHRITDGLSQGVYRLLPQQPVDDDEPGTPTAVHLLGQILKVPATIAQAAWIDDRYVNQFSFAGAARITDTVEVLAALESRGALSEDRRLALLMKLRAANVRYIPPTAGELVRHLQAAAITRGSVVETRALTVLRQYIAATLVDRTALQIPATPVTSPLELREFPYLLAINHAAVDGIVQLWRIARTQSDSTELALEQARARAQWIVDNILLDLGLLRATVVHPDRPPDAGVSAAGLSALVGYAVTLLDEREHPHDATEDSCARLYLEWVWHAVVEPRMALDPAIRVAMIDRIRGMLTRPPRGASDDPSVVVFTRLLAGRLHDIMPSALQEELSKDTKFLEFAGREMKEVYGDGVRSYPAQAFTDAITAVMRGESVRLADVTGEEVELQPAPPPGVFQIQQVGSGAPSVVGDPAFLVLADDPDTRRDGIHRLSRELDLPPGEEETLVEEIKLEERARTRLGLLERRRAESLYRQYRALEDDLRSTRRFAFDRLEPPTVAAVLAHLRLSLGQDEPPIVEGLETAGDNLVAQVGIEEAFHRLSGLPLPLPETLVKAITGMEHEARRKLIRRLLRVPTSPIARIHGLRLLSALVSQDPPLARLARRITRRFGDNQWASEVEVFRQVLLNALDHIELRTSVGDYPPSALLAAWYHAHRVACAFLAAGADASKLSDFLARAPGREWTAYFSPEKLGWLDIAHGRHVNSLRLAFAGITYALERDNGEVLTADVVAHLTARFTVTKDKQRVPETNLHFDTNRLENCIDSFLPLDTDDVGGFARTRVPIFAEVPTKQQIVEESVEGLEQDITNLGSWLTLHLVVGVARMDEKFETRVLAAFRSMELATVVQAAGVNAAIPIMQTCWVVGACGTDSDRSKTLKELRDVVRVVANTRRSGAPANQSDHEIDAALETALLEGAFALARGEPTPESCVRTFASALSSFAEEDPSWWARIRPILESLVGGLKLELAHWVTPSLLKARAASSETVTDQVAQGEDGP